MEPGFHSLAEAHFIRGVCRARAGQFDEAAVDFEESLWLAVKASYSQDVEIARELLGVWDPPPVTELDVLLLCDLQISYCQQGMDRNFQSS